MIFYVFYKSDSYKALEFSSSQTEVKLYNVSPELNFNLTPSGSIPTVSDSSFRKLGRLITTHIGESDNIFVYDSAVGANRLCEYSFRTITNSANINLYLKHILPPQPKTDPMQFVYQMTVFISPDLPKDELQSMGITSDAFAVFHAERGILIIGGTTNTKAIKDAIISAVSARMAHEIVPSLVLENTHILSNGSSSVLVHDPSNILGQVKNPPTSNTGLTSNNLPSNMVGVGGAIWNHYGAFRMFQGITHSEKNIPRQRGDIVETIVDDKGKSVATRITQSISGLPNFTPNPSSFVFLVNDESSVLPQLSRLTSDQASKYFASGYLGKSGSFKPNFQTHSVVGQPGHFPQLFKELGENSNTTFYVCNVAKKGGELSANELQTILNSLIDGSISTAKVTKFDGYSGEIISTLASLNLSVGHGWDPNAYKKALKEFSPQIGL